MAYVTYGEGKFDNSLIENWALIIFFFFT
jgi:hypothetical protein